MPSTSEVGHAKNVANLQKLTEQVTVYTLYNPPVENLTVANLQALYTTANTNLSEVEDKRNANKNAITLRQSAFENLKSTCTRIINLLEVLGLTNHKVLVCVKELTDNVCLAARNLANVKVVMPNEVNTYDLVSSDNLLIEEEALTALEEVLK